MNTQSFYAFNRSQLDELGYQTKFRAVMEDVAYKIGISLKPLTFYALDAQKGKGVLELGYFNGLNGSGRTLEREVESEWDTGCPAMNSRTAFLDYLLSTSVCYVELHRGHRINGKVEQTYSKNLVTRSPDLVQNWLGEGVQIPKRVKIEYLPQEYTNGQIRCVYLNDTKTKGHTIAVPRDPLYAQDVRCLPQYMLIAYAKGLSETLQNGVARVKYLKTNSTVRVQETTLSVSLLDKCYKGEPTSAAILSQVDLEVRRGSIKLPEVGLSRTDPSMVRSVSLMRLLSLEPITIEEVDTNYLDVDLQSVVKRAEVGLTRMLYERDREGYREFAILLMRGDVLEEVLRTIERNDLVQVCKLLTEFIEYSKKKYSTLFIKSLHKVLLKSTASVFRGYTGEPEQARDMTLTTYAESIKNPTGGLTWS